MRKHALITSALMLAALVSFGGGYQVNVQGLRQVAMGGSGTGWMWDASSIFYNPGGLARLKNIQAYGSVQFLIANTQYAPTGPGTYPERSKTGFYTPFNVYVGGRLREEGKLGIGLGVYTPFGSRMTWDNDWQGRYVIQKISLQSIFFQPTVSYKIADAVSVGAGFIYAAGNVKLNRALPVMDENGRDGRANLKGNAHGTGFNLGVHVRAGNRVQIGLNYRSQVNMSVKNGNAAFEVPASLSASFPNTRFSADLPLPQVATLGVGFRPADRLTITAEVNWIGWNAYDFLEFDYEKNTAALQDSREPRNYENTVAFRLGVHVKAAERFALMAGGAFDPSPAASGYISPDLPDADRWLLTGGLSFKATDNLTILGALEYNVSRKREADYLPANFRGTYQSKAIIPCIGVTYDFK